MGDFNLIIDCKLETNGGNPVLKKKSLAKLIEINESLNLCDIWRIRPLPPPTPPPPPQKKEKHVTYFIRIRFLVSFKYTSRFCQENRCFCIFPHRPSTIFFSFEKGNGSVRGRGLWKFNNSLILDSKYIESMEKHIVKLYFY